MFFVLASIITGYCLSLIRQNFMGATGKTDILRKQRGRSIICFMSELNDDFMTLEDLMRFSASNSEQMEPCTFEQRDPVLRPRV